MEKIVTFEELQEIKDMEDMERELAAQIKVKKAALKAKMLAAGITEIIEGDRVAKVTSSMTTRLDTKRIKVELPEVYEELSITKEEHKLTVR